MKKIILGNLLIVCSLFGNGVNLYNSQCASCHGAKGNEALAGNPLIVGIPEVKLVTILNGYKTGSLKGNTMNSVATGLNDSEIKSLAQYISTFK
jgi:cytochrome c553